MERWRPWQDWESSQSFVASGRRSKRLFTNRSGSINAPPRPAAAFIRQVSVDPLIVSGLRILPIHRPGIASPTTGWRTLCLPIGCPHYYHSDFRLVPLVKFGRTNLDQTARSNRHSLSDR